MQKNKKNIFDEIEKKKKWLKGIQYYPWRVKL